MRNFGLSFSVFFIVSAANAADPVLPDFTQLVELAKPPVVNISTTQQVSVNLPVDPRQGSDALPEDHPFSDLLERFIENAEGDSEIQEFDAASLGSGFIISTDGEVLTNYHVIRGADEIIVRLADRRELPATVIGIDPPTDIALLKIDATDLPVVNIGNVASLKVGEWVLAIGSPFGFDHSVTKGIVSAKGRSVGMERYVPFIQTDVAINPGNSGGPLFNMRGDNGLSQSKNLSETERGRLRLLLLMAIRMWENAFYQSEHGTLESSQWEGILRDILSIVHQPGFRHWWASTPGVVSNDFQAFINGALRSSPNPEPILFPRTAVAT